MKRLSRDKRSSLFGLFVFDEEKSLMTLTPGINGLVISDGHVRQVGNGVEFVVQKLESKTMPFKW